MFKSNTKGFSLFTALVSLLLISITLILIFNMVKTEDTYLSMIEDQSSNSDIITIADLARADAFNLFVVSLRANWETYRNTTDNTIILRRADMDLNWDSFVDNVVEQYFFERKFSQFFAQTLLNKLKYSAPVIGYDIKVDTKGTGSGSGTNYTSDENALAQVVELMFNEAGKKVDVVDCNEDSVDKCTGSFYLTFNATDLNDEMYEKLPTITVKRQKNNEVMQRPVLARAYYKIYMPWRGFQAMRVARRIAYSSPRETSPNPADYPAGSDDGLFNPLLHNTLEQARLGVCDTGTCGPRTNFFITSSTDGFDAQCDKPFSVSGSAANNYQIANFLIPTPDIQYDLGSVDDIKYKNLFDSLAKNVISSNLNSRSNENITFTQTLAMSSDMTGPDYTNSANLVINKISTSISKTTTKDVTLETSAPPGVGAFPAVAFNPSSISNAAGGLGIFYDSASGRGVYPYEIDNSYKTSIITQGISNQNLKCYELDSSGISMDLIFQENNPKYSTLQPGSRTYIHLQDGYTEFAFPGPIQAQGLFIDPEGYLSPYTTSLSPSTNTGPWQCHSYGDPNSTNGHACVNH